jgi:hypothetical protein
MFRSFRKTEPKFFNILRFLCAIVFSVGLCSYTWVSVNEFTSNIYKPNLYLSEAVQGSDDYGEGLAFPGICFKYLYINKIILIDHFFK